jgi:NDP-sugar pyrophosphorylase family protein
MKAMIFAAGLGTRLRPLTNNIPKALVKINNKSLLELIIKKLNSFGFTDIIINIHHFPGKIIHFLEENDYFNCNIRISDETDLLLDTGGGLVNAKSFFNDGKPFLVHNVDVLSDIDLEDLYNHHIRNNAMVTMAVSDRPTMRYLRFSDDMQLVGWENNKTGEEIVSKEVSNFTKLAFSGVHVISPEIFNLLTKKGKFNIIPEYLELSKTQAMLGYKHSANNWMDVGKIENIKNAEELLKDLQKKS